MMRQEINQQIIQLLSKAVEYYPDWRFEQILENLGLNDVNFYRESYITLKLLTSTTCSEFKNE